MVVALERKEEKLFTKVFIVTDQVEFIFACAMFVAFGLILFCTLIIMTVAFPKIREIEKIISAATLNPSTGRNLWGGDPFGRLVRTTQVFSFLAMRNSPGHFRRAASKIGNVNAEVSRYLFLWAFIPTLGLFSFGGVALCGSLIIS